MTSDAPGTAGALTIDDVRTAALRIAAEVRRTPLLLSDAWSERIGVEVFFKCENLQRTGSFKLRGAMNKVRTLLDGQSETADGASSAVSPTGVITASSGNHGQAVAYAARRAGLPCVVVVPETVLAVKEGAIRQYGAEVIRCGRTSRERIELAEQLSAERGLVFVPPYDDPAIIAGQGTAALEVLSDRPDIGTFIVPIGGGGLTSGTALTVKSLQPKAVVWAAEPELADDTWQSVQAGKIVEIGESKTIADGLRSSHPGVVTFPLVQKYVDEVVLVGDSAIEEALLHLFMRQKLVIEPSGSVSLAALMTVADHGGDRLSSLQSRGPVVCILSGGNVDPQYLAAALNRSR
ncbi:threonine ammonia-lyase [Alicyclobacillus sp. ALC3]|uniref:threonine ammonia-lyase n=1 Tax=Alicyclobacillus sp. ALC3 TaxID=2796143 RepID=UPI0023799865|nr:threonine/serine dehydratase [Alicyclobacillus sp. ALC3]WDL95868.1 threonine/serine dehydratase [Alicyclobacillus sp. ALC3]